jgi:biotin synthase
MTLAAIEAPAPLATPVRHDWSRSEIRALFELPFPELMFRAQNLHRAYFDPTECSPTLSQSRPVVRRIAPMPQARIAKREADQLMSLDAVLSGRATPAAGASPSAGAAWRGPKERPRQGLRDGRGARLGSRPAPRLACSLGSRRTGSKRRRDY